MGDVILQLDSIVQRHEDKIMSSSLGDELVMMNFESGDYFGINAIGNKIWEYLKEPIQVNVIIKNLCALYDVAPAQCEEETLSFVSNLLKEDMITVR